MSRKNIVFLLNEYNGHGGAQRVASILAEEFYEDGHSVSVLSINEQKNESSYFSKNIPVKLVHTNDYRPSLPIELSSNLKKLRFKKVFSELKRRYLLERKRKFVQNYFDSFGDQDVFVIVIQVYGMQWLEPLIYRPNIKIIGQSHESVIASKGSHRYSRILSSYRQVEKFLLLTEKDADHFENLGFRNLGVMHNPSPFREYIDPEVLFENKTIVSTGRLVDEKGFDILIESFSRVATELPDWKLHIFGDGPAKKSLQSLIDVLDMNDRIKLKGQTTDIPNVLKSSSFFVLSSIAEGLPMSLIEAQSYGLPCISTDCAPGIREIINEYEDGFISPVDDIMVLSRHIMRLATQKEKYLVMSNNAFKNSARFQKDVIKNKWYDIFEELGGK